MTREEIRKLTLKFLREHKTAVLATATRQGEPQAATVFYYIDDDFTFNFVTDKKSRKFQNLKDNPHVAIVVGSGPDVMTVQCGGHAEIIDYGNDTKTAEEIAKKVMKNSSLGGAPPGLPVLLYPLVELAYFKVKPEWMVLLNLEYQKHSESYQHDYHKVLP